MSHPAASIKSIFSGKVNLTDTDLAYDSTPKNSSFDDDKNDYDMSDTYPNRTKLSFDDDFSEYGIPDRYNIPQMKSVSEGDNYSVSSKNLRIMAMQKGELFNVPNSSTDISLASLGSDYQQEHVTNDLEYNTDTDWSQPEVSVSESFSRPMSRNSTTSCLSTTATKDGIEGKKLHRHGPTPYSSNVIANMIQHQQLLPQPQRLYLSQSSGMDNLSTATQNNGETVRKKLPDIDSLGPPVTLKEKMNLLNRENPKS